MGRNKILLMLAVLGVVAGFAVMRYWGAGDGGGVATGNPSSPGATESGGTPSALASSPPAPRGSNISVVGSMSRKELIRRGVEVPPLPEAPPPAAGPPAGQGPPPRREEVPASIHFPSAVARAASDFMCLCGCGHRLHECPCNDQPIGAVTMLTYLQKLMSTDPDPAALSRGMIDRYGEKVLVTSDSE